MKTIKQDSLLKMNTNELELLTREVKETIAFDAINNKTETVFTAANLWKIHKMRRQIKSRKMFIQ